MKLIGSAVQRINAGTKMNAIAMEGYNWPTHPAVMRNRRDPNWTDSDFEHDKYMAIEYFNDKQVVYCLTIDVADDKGPMFVGFGVRLRQAAPKRSRPKEDSNVVENLA